MVDTFRVLDPKVASALVLTCEHASCVIPTEYGDLGLSVAEIEDHIGWDIGAAAVTELLAAEVNAPAVLSAVSRLMIDCNRDLSDHDLIVTESHGVMVPGNSELDEAERLRRIRKYYDPYHSAVDAVIAERRPSLLLSIHSFTPVLNGRKRCLDVGVLFDDYPEDAKRLGDSLSEAGLVVRYNEPYSGLEGMIFSACSHGGRHGVRYLELELNNGLLRNDISVQYLAARVGVSLCSILQS